jgi:pimeloyl-ACP methyl ester carboxylesterase
MLRRIFLTGVAATGVSLAAANLVLARTNRTSAATPQGAEMAHSTPQSGYAPVNGLDMYYEIHGTGQPLVLLHGAYGSVATDFGKMLPALAETRQVIGIEQQAHGHTADVDRPIRYEQMAEDTAALLRSLKIEAADFFGYSMGGNIALQVAMRHPDLVRKVVAVSANVSSDGYYPEVLAGIAEITPDIFEGSPWLDHYRQVAPNPGDFPKLVEKLKDLDAQPFTWPAEEIRAIAAPVLIVIGDSDVVRPEHAVEMFRLLGGGVPGDLTGLPKSQLAVLPGTTHISVISRDEWLRSMIAAFLDTPMSEGQ